MPSFGRADAVDSAALTGSTARPAVATAAVLRKVRRYICIFRGLAFVCGRMQDRKVLKHKDHCSDSKGKCLHRKRSRGTLRALSFPGDMQWWTLKQLKSSSAKSRLSAVEKLGAEGESGLVEPLSNLLSDPDAAVRAATALALGRIKSETALVPLAAGFQTETEPGVRCAIIKALG